MPFSQAVLHTIAMKSSSALPREPHLRWRTFQDRQLKGSQHDISQWTTSSVGGDGDKYASWILSSAGSEGETPVSLCGKRNNYLDREQKGGVKDSKGPPQCPYCDREVFDEQEPTRVVAIFGLTWHSICFRCDRCSRPLKSLGGFICILNSPICLECYLAVNPTCDGPQTQVNTDETTLHTCASSSVNQTYGDALSSSLPGELFSVLYFDEGNNEELFMDTILTFKQLDTSYEAFRRNSTPLLMYSELQGSSNFGYESFSRVLTADDDDSNDKCNGPQSPRVAKTRTSCPVTVLNELHNRMSSQRDDSELAFDTGQPENVEEYRDPLTANDSPNRTCIYDDVANCRLDDMKPVRRADTPAPFASVFEHTQDRTAIPADATIVTKSYLSGKTFICLNRLEPFQAASSLGVTHRIQAYIASKERGSLQAIHVGSHDKFSGSDEDLQHSELQRAEQLRENGTRHMRKASAAALGLMFSIAIPLMTVAFCTYRLFDFS